MTDNLYSPAFDALEHLKRSAEREASASVDFSERIMNRIQMESVSTATSKARRRQRKTLIIASSVAFVLVLLSGFAYAATSTDRFVVKDKFGRNLMQVNASAGYPIEQKRIDHILEKVTAQLQPGEGAQVLIGQENIDDYMNNGSAGSIYTTSQSLIFKTSEEVSSRLPGVLNRMKLPGDNIGDAKLVQVELVPYFEVRNDISPERWVKATDTETGYPYAYYKIVPGAGSVESEFSSLRFAYANEDSTYSLVVSYGKQIPQIYDIRPSADRIYEAAGVPIYRLNEANDSFSLVWSNPAADGSIVFTLHRTPSDPDKELDFAQAVIEATAIGSE